MSPTKNFAFEWIDDKSPLLLLPEKYLQFWEGANQPSFSRIIETHFRFNTDGSATDYDRACDAANERLNLVEVGDGNGVVFGDESLMTAWLSSTIYDGGMFIRWVYAENETNLIQFARNISDGFFKDESFSISIDNSDLILFPAAENGIEKKHPRLRITLPNGRYLLSTADVSDEQTSVICHRLRKVD